MSKLGAALKNGWAFITDPKHSNALMAIFTIGIFVTGFLYTVGAFLQWQTMRYQLELDQWPYLVASKLELPSTEFGPGETWVNLTFKNIGKSIGFNPKPYRAIGIVKLGNDAVAFQQIEALYIAALKDLARLGTSTIAPQEEQLTSTPKISITAADVAGMRNSESELVVVAGMKYEDVFGHRHETQMCRSLFGPPPVAWRYCSVHNTMK